MKTALVIIVALVVGAGTAAAANCGGCGGHDKQETAFARVTGSYLTIQTALAADSIDGVGSAAKAVADAAHALMKDFSAEAAGVAAEDAEACRALLPQVAEAAGRVGAAGDLDSARAAFAELSDAMVAYRGLAGGERPQVAWCGMAKHHWLQDGDAIANPYYGASMLRCGSFVKK
ncbi:MAG: DUF3347 domain-containing protein [Candidatus Krumholzibacteriia bacterium]